MFSFIGLVFNFISGGLADKVLQWQKNKLDSENSKDTQLTELALQELQSRQAIVAAELGNRWTAGVRAIGEFACVGWFFKAAFVDKVLAPIFGLNLSTDDLNGDVRMLAMIIFTGMYGSNIAGKVVDRLTK